MTDFRALCAELLAAIDASTPYAMPLRERVRAALDQPVAEGPTSEELEACADEFLDWNPEGIHAFARAILARWGTPNSAEIRRSMGDAPQPIPVSERLPGLELSWWYEPDEDEDDGYGGSWTLLRIRGGTSTYTHWLPAHALLVPADG